VTLTPRQLAVLRLVAEGKTNVQIARALRVALGTVEQHVFRMRERMGAVSRAHAVHLAWQQWLLGEAS